MKSIQALQSPCIEWFHVASIQKGVCKVPRGFIHTCIHILGLLPTDTGGALQSSLGLCGSLQSPYTEGAS